jgi:hypothetical protein
MALELASGRETIVELLALEGPFLSPLAVPCPIAPRTFRGLRRKLNLLP